MKLKNFVLVQSAEKEERPIIEEIGEITQNSIMQALELCYNELEDRGYSMGLQNEITFIFGNNQKTVTVETLFFKALQIELNM